MAEVFLAEAHTDAGQVRKVALKRVLPGLACQGRFVEMFFDEARLAMELSHPNIVHTYAAGSAGDGHYLVMEYVEGLTLRALMGRFASAGERIPVPIACYVVMEVSKGLAYAHSARGETGEHLGVVHRDVTPPNILLSREGEVKITDFGLSKALSHAHITEPGVVKGKYAYLAPEILNGEKSDPRADIFALGVCLWEMLAGRRLFLGQDEADTIERARRCEVPPLEPLDPSLSHALDAIVQRTLHSDPSRRIPTAQELGDALADYLSDHNLAVSSHDLAALLEGVSDSDPATPVPAEVGELIAAEIADLERKGVLVGDAPAGSAPLQPERFAGAGSALYDLSRLWAHAAAARGAEAPTLRERTPTVEAMVSASSPANLARMLEGERPTTREALAIDARSMGPGTRQATDKTRWIWLAILVGAAGATVLFAL
jgi:serine/threonine-protein kinase